MIAIWIKLQTVMKLIVVCVPSGCLDEIIEFLTSWGAVPADKYFREFQASAVYLCRKWKPNSIG
jgi:hypothetical protein